MSNLVSKKSNNKMALISLANIYSTICDQEKAIELYKKAEHLEFELSTMYYIKSNPWKIKFNSIKFSENNRKKIK
jgi:hypothetical protein